MLSLAIFENTRIYIISNNIFYLRWVWNLALLRNICTHWPGKKYCWVIGGKRVFVYSCTFAFLYYHRPKVNCLLLTGKRDAVPVRLNGAANLIVIVARRSKQCRGCLFLPTFIPTLILFLLEIVCEFSHFQESWDVAMSALLGTRPSNSCTFCKKHYLSPLTLLTSLVFVTNSLSNIDFWLCKLVKQAWKQAWNSFFIIWSGELYCTQCNSKRRSIRHVL